MHVFVLRISRSASFGFGVWIQVNEILREGPQCTNCTILRNLVVVRQHISRRVLFRRLAIIFWLPRPIEALRKPEFANSARAVYFSAQLRSFFRVPGKPSHRIVRWGNWPIQRQSRNFRFLGDVKIRWFQRWIRTIKAQTLVVALTVVGSGAH